VKVVRAKVYSELMTESMSAFVFMPVIRLTSFPFLKKIMVGIDWTPNRSANS
jgi:hypothetical protein